VNHGRVVSREFSVGPAIRRPRPDGGQGHVAYGRVSKSLVKWYVSTELSAWSCHTVIGRFRRRTEPLSKRPHGQQEYRNLSYSKGLGENERGSTGTQYDHRQSMQT
jgi:hypothetical protein